MKNHCFWAWRRDFRRSLGPLDRLYYQRTGRVNCSRWITKQLGCGSMESSLVNSKSEKQRRVLSIDSHESTELVSWQILTRQTKSSQKWTKEVQEKKALKWVYYQTFWLWKMRITRAKCGWKESRGCASVTLHALFSCRSQWDTSSEYHRGDFKIVLRFGWRYDWTYDGLHVIDDC